MIQRYMCRGCDKRVCSLKIDDNLEQSPPEYCAVTGARSQWDDEMYLDDYKLYRYVDAYEDKLSNGEIDYESEESDLSQSHKNVYFLMEKFFRWEDAALVYSFKNAIRARTGEVGFGLDDVDEFKEKLKPIEKNAIACLFAGQGFGYGIICKDLEKNEI